MYVIGLVALFYAKKFNSKKFVICLTLIPILYLPIRATGYWDGINLCEYLYYNFNQERAQSLFVRFDNENTLTEKARIHPVFGWGGWGRARVRDEKGKDITIADSLWIISFGNNGAVGLCSITITIMRRYNTADWFHPKLIPVVTLSMLLCLYMIDNLLNSMTNPIYMVAAGGIISLGRELFNKSETAKIIDEELWIRPDFKPRFI